MAILTSHTLNGTDGTHAGGIKVKVGLHNVNGTTGSITRYVDQIIVHPSKKAKLKFVKKRGY